jgi:hypothetical protein
MIKYGKCMVQAADLTGAGSQLLALAAVGAGWDWMDVL